jgi:hypothetical protein
VTRELVAADVTSLTHRVDFTKKFSATLGSLLGVMAFPELTPPRDPPVDFGVFPLNTVKMDSPEMDTHCFDVEVL